MISQVVLFCLVSVVVTKAYVVPGYGNPAYEPVYDTKPEPYAFGFDTKDEYGNTLSRKEEGDELGNKRGSYGYVDAYGIYRQVDYVADDKGFRAVIKTNEPGTESQNPADTELLSEAVPAKYDAPVAYAKAPVAAAYARPAAVSAPVYSNPAVHAAPASHLAPVAPLSPAAPLAPLAPAAPLAPVYGEHGPAVYAPGPAVYAPSAAYAPAPAVYSPSAAYAHGPVYEPLSPQSYAGPSYEQLVDKAGQPTESRNYE